MKYFIILIVTFTLQSEFLFSENYKKIRIEFDSNFTVEKFLKLDMIDNCSSPKLFPYAELIVNEFEFNNLKKLTGNIQILNDDMEGFYENQIAKSSTDELLSNKNFVFGTMGYFYKLDEIYQEFDKMKAKFPIFFIIDTIGITFEKKPIIAYKISTPDMPPIRKPNILLTALHHAREPVSAMTLVYYFWQLFENYENGDKLAQYILKNKEFTVIPVVNPDGYFYNQTLKPDGGGLWRKNRRPVDTLYGIDLNRNYGPQKFWNNIDGGSSNDARNENYRGDTCFSELETKAIAKLCKENVFDVALNFHCYANAIVYPWEYKSIETDDSTFFIGLSRYANQKNNYDFGCPLRTVNYVARGGSDDWMYWGEESAQKTFAMSPEIGDFFDGFWPPKQDIIPEMDKAIVLLEQTILSTDESLILDNYEFDENNSTLNLNFQNIGLKSSNNIDKLTISTSDVNISIPIATKQIPLTKAGEFIKLIFDIRLDNRFMNGSNVKFVIQLDDSYKRSFDTINIILKQSIQVKLYNGESKFTEFISDSLWGIYRDPKLNLNYISCDTAKKVNKYPITTYLTSNEFYFPTATAIALELSTKWFIERNYDFGVLQIFNNSTQTWDCLKTKRMHQGETFDRTMQDSSLFGFDGYFPLFEDLSVSISQYLPKFKLRFGYLADGNSQTNEWLIKSLELKVFEDLTNVDYLPLEQNISISIQNKILDIEINDNSILQNIQLININGQIVFSKNLLPEDSKSLNLNQLTDGFYLINIKTNKQNIIKKMILN